MQSIGQMVFWLVVVLLMIPASLFLLKRSGLAQRSLGGVTKDQVLRTVAQTALGPGQRVVTLEVSAGGQKTWLILGVTGQQITTLSQMPAPVESGASLEEPGNQSPDMGAAAMPPAFAALLKRVQGQRATHQRKAA